MELKRFIKVNDALDSIKDNRISASPEVIGKLVSLQPNNFVFAKYTINSPPAMVSFSEIPDNNIVAFVREAMKINKVSLKDIKDLKAEG